MTKLPVWCASLTTSLVLLLVCLWDYYPPLGPQRITVVFPLSSTGKTEPLIVTGKPQAADFLAVRYLEANQIAFVYDSWGQGGPVSAPVTFTPGRRYSLEIEMPSLSAVPANVFPLAEKIRVILDGRVVLEAIVPFHQRGSQHAFFGQNPVGGTTCDATFRGSLLRATGERFPATVRELLSHSDRIFGWLTFAPWQLVLVALLGLGAGWIWNQLRSAPATAGRQVLSLTFSLLRTHSTFLATSLFCSLVFAAVVTNGTFHLIYPEVFGDFYDFQARSILSGRLDVPRECLRDEVFTFAGKTYGYFGPTPALLRLPFVIFGLAFGSLSRAAMLVYFVAVLVGAYLILRHALRLLRPETTALSPVALVFFILHIGLGSTVLFLGSRAYIYHEAILCGVAFAIWSCWCTLRHCETRRLSWWFGALLLGTCSLHARAPTGLFALLFLIACTVTPLLQGDRRLAFGRPLLLSACAAIALFSYNLLSYAKFKTFDGCPLRLNSQYHAERLARIESKQFHLSNLPYGLDTYFFRPAVTVSPRFPWLYLPPRLPAESYPAAKLDLNDRTFALPIGMSGLFLLATLAGGWLAWRTPSSRTPLIALWLAFIPQVLALSAAVATAERYTADFLPFLVCASAFGLLTLHARPLRLSIFVALTIWSGALTAAATIHYQGKMVWGVPDHVTERYQRVRESIDSYFGVRPAP